MVVPPPRSPPQQLPSLDLDQANGRNVAGGGAAVAAVGTSSSLRGSQHTKVPEISYDPLNTPLPMLKDGEVHPEPYYITQNVILKVPDIRPPWISPNGVSENNLLYEHWKSHPQFQAKYVQEMIKDAIFLDINGICAAANSESLAESKQEGQALYWLEDHVVTDVSYDLSTELAWKLLWDQARKLPKGEIEELHQEYGKKGVDPNLMKVLRANYTKPLTVEEGKNLVHHTWGELLYHLNRLMQRGSLMENYAIKRLQEQIVTQVAAKVLLDEALKFMEDEFEGLDEDERVDNPPRQG